MNDWDNLGFIEWSRIAIESLDYPTVLRSGNIGIFVCDTLPHRNPKTVVSGFTPPQKRLLSGVVYGIGMGSLVLLPSMGDTKTVPKKKLKELCWVLGTYWVHIGWFVYYFHLLQKYR